MSALAILGNDSDLKTKQLLVPLTTDNYFHISFDNVHVNQLPSELFSCLWPSFIFVGTLANSGSLALNCWTVLFFFHLFYREDCSTPALEWDKHNARYYYYCYQWWWWLILLLSLLFCIFLCSYSTISNIGLQCCIMVQLFFTLSLTSESCFQKSDKSYYQVTQLIFPCVFRI